MIGYKHHNPSILCYLKIKRAEEHHHEQNCILQSSHRLWSPKLSWLLGLHNYVTQGDVDNLKASLHLLIRVVALTSTRSKAGTEPWGLCSSAPHPLKKSAITFLHHSCGRSYWPVSFVTFREFISCLIIVQFMVFFYIYLTSTLSLIRPTQVLCSAHYTSIPLIVFTHLFSFLELLQRPVTVLISVMRHVFNICAKPNDLGLPFDDQSIIDFFDILSMLFFFPPLWKTPVLFPYLWSTRELFILSWCLFLFLYLQE